MDGSRPVVGGAAVIIALIAVVLSLVVIFAPASPAAAPPQTIDLSLLITSAGTVDGPALSHLYDPQLMVVRRGDTVRLRVMNQSFFRHGIEIADYRVRTGELNGGQSEVLTFTANKPGVFAYRCYLPYDPATATCALDHAQMIGHLVVIEPGRQ